MALLILLDEPQISKIFISNSLNDFMRVRVVYSSSPNNKCQKNQRRMLSDFWKKKIAYILQHLKGIIDCEELKGDFHKHGHMIGCLFSKQFLYQPRFCSLISTVITWSSFQVAIISGTSSQNTYVGLLLFLLSNPYSKPIFFCEAAGLGPDPEGHFMTVCVYCRLNIF